MTRSPCTGPMVASSASKCDLAPRSLMDASAWFTRSSCLRRSRLERQFLAPVVRSPRSSPRASRSTHAYRRPSSDQRPVVRQEVSWHERRLIGLIRRQLGNEIIHCSLFGRPRQPSQRPSLRRAPTPIRRATFTPAAVIGPCSSARCLNRPSKPRFDFTPSALQSPGIQRSRRCLAARGTTNQKPAFSKSQALSGETFMDYVLHQPAGVATSL
jgi:hypothetical protein